MICLGFQSDNVDREHSITKANLSSLDVNQYNFTFSKGFKIDNLKLKATLIAKNIDIDGSKYGGYTFKDNDYFTTGLKLGTNYNSYIAGVSAFFGKRAFTVLDDGLKVQYHAKKHKSHNL